MHPRAEQASGGDRRDLPDLLHEFRRHKDLAGRALRDLSDAQFFQQLAPQVNSIAIIVKHLAGNLRSRWTDFLTSDGEKPDRRRDREFVVTPDDTRASLMAAWESGWETVLATVADLRESDLGRTVTIRGEPHTVFQTLLRGLSHAAYHVGQILYLARLLRPDGPWLTIAPGQSDVARGGYLKPPGT
jgi:uncharacterized damage-inducible protein DinB